MRKSTAFLFSLLLLSLFFLSSFAKTQEKILQKRPTEVIKVQLLFEKKTITTKTLKDLLQNQGFLLQIVFRNNFPYLDESMEKKFSLIYSPDIEKYEQKFQKQLNSYGFFEESERVGRQGVLLEKVTVQIPYSLFLSLKNISGIKVISKGDR